MATRTSSQTGPWNLSSTWGGAAAPGVGDIAVIASGHTVTVSTTVEVGDDVGLAVTLVGNLIVNSSLTIRSGTNAIAISQQRTSSVTISRVGANAGSLTFNPASGVTPHWDTPNTGTGTPLITITGEAGDLVPITTSLARSGNRAYFDWTAYPPNLNWDYVSFSEMGGVGDTTATRWLSYIGVAASSIVWDFVRCVSCGAYDIQMNGESDITLNWNNCDFRAGRNTASSTYGIIQVNTARVTGTRLFYQCTWYHTTRFLFQPWLRDFKFEGCVAWNTQLAMGAFDRDNWFFNCVFLMNASTSGQVSVSGQCFANHLVEDCLFGVDQTLSDNPHYCDFSDDFAVGPEMIKYNVIDGFGVFGSDTGDFFITQAAGTVERNLIINQAGVLFPIVSLTAKVTCRRNTQCDAGASPNGGETNGHALALVRFSSNLTAFNTHGIHQDPTFVSQTVFNMDYNGFWNMTDPTNIDHPVIAGNPNSYLGVASAAAWWTSGAFGDDNKGLHDVYGDPQFVDRFRNMVTWYNSVIGSGGTFAVIAGEMIKLNGTSLSGTDATFNTALTGQACKDYIRAGFKPQNPIYFNTGDPDDGSPSIGAIDLDPPASPPQITIPRRNTFRRRVIGADAA